MRNLASILVVLFTVASGDTGQAPRPVGAGFKPAPTTSSRLPPPELNPTLAAPITRWDEAIPLGNGLLGGLLWGQDNVLRLSLDRGDLWDERPADGVEWHNFNYRTARRLVAEGRNDEFNRIFDKPYDDLHPTKLPAGRIEIVLDPGARVTSFELNLASAEGRAHVAGVGRVEAFFSAVEPVALVRIPGAAGPAIRALRPDSLAKLGYRAPRTGGLDGTLWFEQDTADGHRFCVLSAARRVTGGTLVALTVTSTRDGPDPVGLAVRRAGAALDRGYDASRRPHAAWWRAFWSASRVAVPDAAALRHYYLAQYFYGAASRPGAPPMPLQGVWTADNGTLPPWKGDYHNDLNTQTTYLAYQVAGRFDEGRVFLDFLWDLLPRFRAFAKEFYEAPGAAVPGVMSLAGQPLGGWGQYSLSPTMSAWCAHLFYLHWRYTMDAEFLRERAYPWCREVGVFLRHLLQADESGTLKLPLSSSPEIHDNGARAWLVPNSNFDVACLRMLYLGLAEMASALGQPADAKDWSEVARRLGPFHVNGAGELRLDAAADLAESHRHLSNLMAVHPFNLITIDGGPGDSRIIDASLRQWDRLGTRAWVGYTFAWMACLRARVGDAEAAWRNLAVYLRAFILRNGFHANGDQLKAGYSDFTYRPFTLEGNFLAAQAIHEMLLQSWSPSPGTRDTEVIRLFPAVPAAWADASFDDLRVEGGHRVSARREAGTTVWLRITADRDGTVRVRDSFGGRPLRWNAPGVRQVGVNFEATVRRGQVLEATTR